MRAYVVFVVALCVAVAVVATPSPSSSALPEPKDPSAYTGMTYYLLTSNRSVIGNYTVVTPTNGSTANNDTSPIVSVAELIYNESSDEIGWDFVQVTAHQELVNSNEDKGFRAYYAAGYLEAYVTAKRIGQIYVGLNLTIPQPLAVGDWLDQHYTYMNSKAAENMRAGYPDPFWTQLGNFLAQMEGMAAGYTMALMERNLTGRPNQPNLTLSDFFLLNFNNELSDVYSVLNITSPAAMLSAPPIQKQMAHQNQYSTDKLLPFKNRNLHCSALVKVTNEDIFFSHDTWNGYSTMLRQYKVYKFQTTVSMSGAAGTIASGDDWYITSNNLAVQETTNDYYNMSLLEFIVPETASEFLRVMVATFLANNGREWVELFQFNNSGTYCNQWMVLDYKLYTPGQKGDALLDNLLWVAEQIPGNVTSADVTQTLRETSYWASYNIPYFPNIYNLSGFAELEQEYGPVFSYTKYARPEIFKRNNTDVVDLESMRRLMRYNNWQEDPLSLIPLCPECNPKSSPWLAIASRGDLVGSNDILPSNNGYASQFARQSMGAIDSKIASYVMMQNGGGMGNVINGPTTDDGQPIFIFDEAFPGQRPPGCANVFNYSWVFFNVVGGGKPIPAATTGDDAASRNVILGVCIAVPIALVIAALALAKHRKRMAAMDEYSPLTQ